MACISAGLEPARGMKETDGRFLTLASLYVFACYPTTSQRIVTRSTPLNKTTSRYSCNTVFVDIERGLVQSDRVEGR